MVRMFDRKRNVESERRVCSLEESGVHFGFRSTRARSEARPAERDRIKRAVVGEA